MKIGSILSRIRAGTEKNEDDRVIYVDGVKYEKHTVRSRVLGYPIGEQYFPVAEDDSMSFLLVTFVGGLFGVHKFITGEWCKGLFYLLTCGGFGVFYCFDILSILLGIYSIKQIEYDDIGGKIEKKVTRVYLDRISKEKIKYGLLAFILRTRMPYWKKPESSG